MDKIIFGIFASQESKKVKKQVLSYFKKQAKDNISKMSNKEKQYYWVTCCHFHHTEKGHMRDEAKELHKLLIENDWENFGYVLQLKDIKKILSNGNLSHMYSLFNWPLQSSIDDEFSILFVLSFLELMSDILNGIKDKQKMYNVYEGSSVTIRSFCVKIFYACNTANECAQASEFFINHSNCFDTKKSQAVCNVLVEKLSKFNIPPLSTSLEFKRDFHRDVTAVAAMIRLIWTWDEKTSYRTIVEVFRIVTQKSSKSPSLALGTITKIVPTQLVTVILEDFLHNLDIEDEKLLKGFNEIVRWLLWPTAENCHDWILSFLRHLKSVKKYSCLIDAIFYNTLPIFRCIRNSNTRQSCLRILEEMLLAYQHSPHAFHLIIPEIPKMIEHIKNENLPENHEYLSRLNLVLQCLMYKFSGFPELYSQVTESLNDFPIINEKFIEQKLSMSSWIPNKTLPTVNRDVYNHFQLSGRSKATNKAGLVNLGNTCFANSVIQLLYNSPGFVKSIIKNVQKCKFDSAHAALEETFAFLKHTERLAFKPKLLMTASRPPWFTEGMQQDCSEYVKFLLDKLKEEEQGLNSLDSNCDEYKVKMRKMCDSRNEDGSDVIVSKQTQVMAGTFTAGSSTLTTHTTCINNLFYGVLQTRMCCLNCNTVSSTTEDFADISLSLFKDSYSSDKSKEDGLKGGAMPSYTSVSMEVETSSNTAATSSSKATHLFDDLLTSYMQDEVLDGDNKYHCNTCDSLQKAKKSISFNKLPVYLFFTIMRFTYDKTLQRRTKILDDVEIKPIIKLPCSNDENSNATLYKLTGIIIHSGSSADSGHYYSYACAENSPSVKPSKEQVDRWISFNDSNTSISNLQSIQSFCEKYERDTVYMLLYTKDGQYTFDTEFREAVINKVQRDNEKFQQEKLNTRQNSEPDNWSSFNNDSDDDDSGLPSVKLCGAEINMTGSRVVF